MASCLWTFICDRVSKKTPGSHGDAVDSVLQLSKVLAQKHFNPDHLPPLIAQLDSLLDILCASPQRIAKTNIPFIPIGIGLLKFYSERTQQLPTVAQTVALMSQAVYLETVKTFLSQAKLQKWLARVSDRPATPPVALALEVLSAFELSDLEARQTIPYFHQSSLADAYNAVLAARLQDWGVSPEQAVKVTTQIARQANRLMVSVLVKHSGSIKSLVDWYRLQGSVVFSKYLGIDVYLEETVVSCFQKPVFSEPFTLPDIYVPLRAEPLTATGAADDSQRPVVLDRWAQKQLSNPDQAAQLMVVWGEPGRGKSIFCRRLADWIYQNEYPERIPILISIDPSKGPFRNFEDFLEQGINRDFARAETGWLSDYNLNFVFLIDGLDDLWMQPDRREQVQTLLTQASAFQEQCAHDGAKGHRIVITGRPATLQALLQTLPAVPTHLNQVRLLPMDNPLRRQWLDQWENLLAPEQPSLTKVLADRRLPEWLRELTREPLMLYVVAAMYRDGNLRPEMLAWMDGANAKMLFYERMLAWSLTAEAASGRSLSNADGSPVAPLASGQIREVLRAAASAMMQFGCGFTHAQMTSNDGATAPSPVSGLSLWQSLARFYLQPIAAEEPLSAVRKSFGELLCAEHIVSRLIEGSRPGSDRPYAVDDGMFCKRIYDLLGFPGLTPDILEYLMFVLSKHSHQEAQQLHTRLYDFYWRWSQGEFIDAPPENLPQQKMRLLKEKACQPGIPLGQRQVDTYTGLNTLTLLLNLHRYGQYLVETQSDKADTEPNPFPFNPCSPHSRQQFEETHLLQIIGISQCLGTDVFKQRVAPFLSGVSLTTANLSNADLEEADFSKAKLGGVSFCNSNLQGAIFRKANLHRADLGGARLTRADFRSANLVNTNLSDANLAGAGLHLANLSKAMLINANLKNAILINANLANANLSGANLGRANLDGATLSQAVLSSANLRSAVLVNAELINVSLINADLRSATMTGARLNGADFRGANLSSADLDSVDLSGANLSGTNLSDVNLSSATLFGVNLFEAKLFEAILQKANLSGANLFRANLGGADLSSTSMSSADLSHADLFEANLMGADLNGADLFEANLGGANLSDTNLSDADLRSTQLVEADLRGANLSNANLFNANLMGAILMGANLSGTNLSGVDLSEADLTGAILSDEHETVQWDEQTNWEGVQGLNYAIGLPEKLMRQVGVFTPDEPHPDLIFS